MRQLVRQKPELMSRITHNSLSSYWILGLFFCRQLSLAHSDVAAADLSSHCVSSSDPLSFMGLLYRQSPLSIPLQTLFSVFVTHLTLWHCVASLTETYMHFLSVPSRVRTHSTTVYIGHVRPMFKLRPFISTRTLFPL